VACDANRAHPCACHILDRILRRHCCSVCVKVRYRIFRSGYDPYYYHYEGAKSQEDRGMANGDKLRESEKRKGVPNRHFRVVILEDKTIGQPTGPGY